MKHKRTNIKNPIYEYVTMFIVSTQIKGLCLSKSVWHELSYGEYDFEDIFTYISAGFCTYDECSKYFQKLDFNSFNDVLNFISSFGWKVINISPADNSAGEVIKYMYTFERKK